MYFHKMNLLLLGAATILIGSTIHAANYTYVGMSVGVINNVASTSTAPNYRGVPMTGNFGYSATLTPTLSLAGEIYGSVTAMDLDDYGLKSRKSYGVSVLPGFMLSDHSMFFVRFGFGRALFHAANVGNKLINGSHMGCGIQFSVSPNMDLRSEYVYKYYKTFANIIDPRQDSFNFGIVYHFPV